MLAALTVTVIAPGLAVAAPAATTPTAITDPAFYSFEQGTIDSGTGKERDNASDVATRIRLTDPVAVDSSWRTLTFTGTSDIQVTVFAYNATGTFLSPSSGWKGLSSPYTYTIPSGAATIDYALSYTSSANIDTDDRSNWLTISAGTDTAATPPITDAAFYDLESGTIASATGLNGGATTRIRLKTGAAVDSSWRTLTFAETAGNPDLNVTVFAYDADGTYLSPSTGWQSLTSPYSYTIPAGTATIRYVLMYRSGDTITPADHASWLTISATAGSTAPPSTSDPAFNDFEQGTIASASGAKRDSAEDDASRIRLKAPVAVDPSWQGLKFDGGPDGGDVWVTIFAYDADGRFLSPSSGWKHLNSPYTYVIPAGTATISYALCHDTTDGAQPINANERSPWLTLSTVVPDPRDNYTVNESSLTPQFTIPGMRDSQGGNFVNGELWIGSESDDGHAVANGTVYVYDIDYATKTATLAHTFKHNFGHLNSFSYDEASGNLIFGNGSGSYTQAPQFYVVKESNIDLDGTDTLDGVHATTFEVPADFGAKCNVIWTDQPDTAVMLTDDGTTVRRIKLATGTAHGQYGVYAPAADGGYNGTWDVLATYHINDAYDVVQSAAWVNDHLVIGLGHGPMSVAVIDLQDDGHMDYEIYRNSAQPQFFEAVFYDPDHHYFGGVNANTGVGYFWPDTNLTFSPDTTAPATAAALDPASPTGQNGWYTGPVRVSLAATDADSGVASTSYTVDGGAAQNYAAPFTVSRDGVHTVRYWSTDAAGNAEAPHSTTISIDAAPPVVSYTGNAGSYTVDQQVSIACTATDPTPGSGLASTTCADVNGPAYSYGLGAHSYGATATDNAGNVGHGSATFTVAVTFDSLKALVARFSTDPNVATGLNDKLTAAATAPSADVRGHQLDAFVHQVDAQTAKALTADQANVLIAASAALR